VIVFNRTNYSFNKQKIGQTIPYLFLSLSRELNSIERTIALYIQGLSFELIPFIYLKSEFRVTGLLDQKKYLFLSLQ
jgi:hypothetical protein